MRWRSVLLLGAALVLLFAAAGTASQGRILRFAGASMNPTGDLPVEGSETIPLGDRTTLVETWRGSAEAKSAFGFCLDFEERFNDLLGLGVTLMYAEPEVGLAVTATTQLIDDATGAVLSESTGSVARRGSGEMTPLLVGPNFHFGPNDNVDLYAGPFLGYVFYGDITIEDDRAVIEDDLAYGAVMGVDVPFGKGSLAFSASARYMVTKAEAKEGGDGIDIDPLTLLVGLGYRF